MTFTATTVDAGNAAELKAFNDAISYHAYANGFEPSARDISLFESLKSAPNAHQYPHLARWYKHIASYTADERKSWGGATTSAAPAAEAAKDDDFDLFGSEDEDDEEKKRITEERLKAYAEKKAKKPGPIAKSTIIYDIKPWDDTISIEDIEKAVRGIEMDGLVWGASKKMPVAFGINKLQISCVIEDDKVSSDSLEEAITGFEDLVQSVDIVAFNKV
uniref:Elongation factor 1-beta n=1 Tax=Panagrolaimus sp. JU765 TaxID=591449 RepID=A0AC34PXY5_9BILA